MTFYEWVRQCLLWDARQRAQSAEQKAAVRDRVREGLETEAEE